MGSGPDRGQSPLEWGEIPYVRTSVHPPLDLLAGPQAPLAGPQAPLAGPQAPLTGPQAPLAGPQASLAGPQASLEGLIPIWEAFRSL